MAESLQEIQAATKWYLPPIVNICKVRNPNQKDGSLLDTGEGGDLTLVCKGQEMEGSTAATSGLAHHGSKPLAEAGFTVGFSRFETYTHP